MVDCIEPRTYHGGERVNAGYVMVLIIDVTQPHLIVENIYEGEIHPWKIMDLRHTISKSKS